MTNGKIIVQCQSEPNQLEMDCVMFGELAVHRTVPNERPRGWRITHARTGLAFPTIYKTKARATAIASKMADLAWEKIRPGRDRWRPLGLTKTLKFHLQTALRDAENAVP